MPNVTFALVEEAVRILHGVAHHTPVLTSCQLDSRSGARVFLKCENFQRVGAFKFRGAYHAIARLMSSQSSRVFATVSSGNHGQGLALACRMQGATAHIVMPKPFSAMKHRALLGYGARVHVVEDRSRADAKLCELVDDYQAVVVHSFNDPFVIAGQGTVMVEFVNQVADLDTVLAPVGGGGLLSGLCLAAQALRPRMAIFACEPAGALDAMDSVKQDRIVPMPNPNTLADGLRTSLGELTLPILRRHVTGFFVVGEDEIVQAMRFAYERLKLVIEPSSAVALVPLLRQEPQLVGKRVGVVLTGGNVEWPGHCLRQDETESMQRSGG
jgi:threonine dehydratase